MDEESEIYNEFRELIITDETLQKNYINKNFKFLDINEDIEIKENLLKGNFIYKYDYKHLKFLNNYNDYSFILYLNKYFDEIPDIDLLNNITEYRSYKIFLIDICNIMNIDNTKILKRFSKLFNYDNEWNDYQEKKRI